MTLLRIMFFAWCAIYIAALLWDGSDFLKLHALLWLFYSHWQLSNAERDR